MLERLNDYNWACAFEYAGEKCYNLATPQVTAAEGDTEVDTSPFAREDVKEILHAVEGCNDGPAWIGVFLLRDGRYAFLSAWCDYTGWD